MDDSEQGTQICPLCCLIVAEGRNRTIIYLKECLHILMQLFLLVWSSLLALVLGALRIIEYTFATRQWKRASAPLVRTGVSPPAHLTATEKSVAAESEQVIDLLESDLEWRRGDPEAKWRRLEEATQIYNDYCKTLSVRSEQRQRWQQMHDQLEQREQHLQWLADNGKAGERDLLHLDQMREERRNLGLRIQSEQNLC